jgi:hypothetical protein
MDYNFIKPALPVDSRLKQANIQIADFKNSQHTMEAVNFNN